MAGISGIGGATGPNLSGLGGDGIGIGGNISGMPGGGTGGDTAGIVPNGTPGTDAGGQSFGQVLSDMVVKRPSASLKASSDLTAGFAAGDNVDPHQMAIASAKAGVELQMSTRTISQAVQAVRTLFQMQI